jgi:hypothetical protein
MAPGAGSFIGKVPPRHFYRWRYTISEWDTGRKSVGSRRARTRPLGPLPGMLLVAAKRLGVAALRSGTIPKCDCLAGEITAPLPEPAGVLTKVHL